MKTTTIQALNQHILAIETAARAIDLDNTIARLEELVEA